MTAVIYPIDGYSAPQPEQPQRKILMILTADDIRTHQALTGSKRAFIPSARFYLVTSKKETEQIIKKLFKGR